MTIDPGTSSVVASSSCLVELLLAILVVANERGFFYASSRICSSFQNREEPLAHFEKRFCLFPTLQKVMMVLKALLNYIVENFVTI